ncbi:hypothetical protein Clacol_003293 [Clathrus columnatus]|uniref:Uncharacterized protein n=1 Tax=Clathrus columnatus TaxID=1419009 RepID=A0AAV5A7T6_9AGAM|nr:hypothetical protein Clacol_003293 [Clathrus columnatus]
MQADYLKTYYRTVDEQRENELDEQVLEDLFVSDDPTPRQCAIVLHIVVTRVDNFSRKLDYTIDKCSELFKEDPPLLNLLKECIKQKKFGMIRDLDMFKPNVGLDAVQELRQDYGKLFVGLLIKVNSYNTWTKEDVINNNAVLYTLDPPSHNAQSANNPYLNPGMRHWELDMTLKRYPESFDLVFESHPDREPKVANDREYVALFQINRTYLTDVVDASQSSALAFISTFKSFNFCNSFIYPSLSYPFTDSQTVAFNDDQSWDFPIFINIQNEGVVRKYTPRNDWIVTRTGLPLVIAETTSQNESDENRMLLQAIALSRVGGYFMKEPSKNQFFIVAIYFTDDLQARRYIVKSENQINPEARVNILKETYNLKDWQRAAKFLLEMLNLSSEIEKFADNFDEATIYELSELRNAAWAITSWSTGRAGGARTIQTDSLPDDGLGGEEDSLIEQKF